jgi:DNA-binding transcriptional regulator YhcF (GntR family)
MIKVLEDIITKKSKDTDIQKKDTSKKIDELPKVLQKNIKTLLNHMEKNGFTKQDLIKILKNEQ